MNTLLLTKLKRMSPARMDNHTSEFASSAVPQFGKWILGISSILMVFLFSFGTAWSQVDLSLSKSISNGNPNVGQTVTYTLTVKNTGTLPASGVVVKDSLPVGGVSFTGSTVVRGGGAFNPSTKRWNVGNVAAGDSAILNIQATVLAQGVFYNIAEVVQMNEQDADSWPNDGALDQDDLASTCFSVPIDWYEGDEFLVSVPSGYKGIVWFYNGTPISDSTVVAGKTVAVVNQDSSLTIKGIGSFSFTTTVGVSCPASGCCAIQIVQGPIYDLALSKTLAPGQSASVIPGSLVTFRISVTNEGNMPATQIAITDSLPTALTIQDPNWSQTGNIATLSTPLAGPLAPGATIFTDIIVRVNNSFTTGTLTNFAQIQNARDGQGGVFTDRDSSPGNGFNNGEDDRDSESIQVSPAPVFDLALSKTLAPGQLGNVVPGATVKYRITVTNQGNVPATQIAISDSLPTGLVLQDAAWTLVGNIATLTTPLAGPLAPSATTFVDITTQVSNSFTSGTLLNYAQIKDARDGQGNPVTDVDSSPGNGFNNGEDDRDSEPIQVNPAPVFDLALSKTLAPGQLGNVVPGATVRYRITVTNQGNVPATQIAISDSLPTGLVLQDAAWTLVGNIATLTTPLAGPLAPSATTFVDITTQVSNSFTSGTLLNYAQIKDAKDGQGNPVTDVDSSPGNGFNNGEDDRDSESIQVSPAPVFDLALSKTLAPGQLVNVVPGATVRYRITVTNQGNVPATQIAISDSLPNGLVLQDAAWTLVGNIATLTTPLAGPLAPSATTFVDITTQVSNSFTGSTLLNYAQIKDAKDGQGNPVTDVDSSPGNGFNNGEDDRDSEPIIVGCPVITLVVSNDTTFCEGGSVTLLATAGIAGSTINWYTSPTGNTPFATTASGVPLIQTPTTPTTYYAEATLINGCKSARQPIAVTVGAKPSTPVCQGLIQNICPATTVNLTTVPISPISTPGGVFEWRTGRFPTDPLVTNLTSVGSGTYYLFEKSVSGCYSNPMVIIINIAPCACDLVFGVSAGADIEICAGSPVPVTATLSGVSTSVTWSTTGTGIFANANALATTYSPSITDILSGNVTLTATTNDPDNAGICVPKSDALSLIINPKPASAFGVACDDTLVCLGKSTKLIGFAPGATIRWYTSATGGTSIGTTVNGGKLVITPTATTTYYAEAITAKGCISDDRTPVTVVVKPCFSDLEVVKTVLTPGPYSPGQLLNYAVTVKNLGVGNAANVTVDDILPASLNYVSAVPSGEYNSLTGVWTIGDMIVSSNRTLVITTTINPNASGTITNTAIVKSPDNDPSKTSNDTSSVTIPVVSLADLMLTKKVSKSNPVAGETITYTLEVKNAGPSVATNVEVTDLLPTGLEFVASSDMTFSSNILKGTFATVGVGETKILTFTAKVLGTGSLRNIAQISKSDQPDPNSTPNNGYNQGEDDDSEVTVIVGCPTITPPIIACADPNICVGGSATLTSIGCTDGTIKWSNGMTGASITVTPTQNTTYTAICQKGECTSLPSNPIPIQIVVPVKPVLASNVSSVCVGGSAILTASNCNGVVFWSTGTTGSPIIVTPTVKTTYTAFCQRLDCVSEIASITIDVTPQPLPPLLVCGKMEICPGESIEIQALDCAGTVKWSNGATGLTITVAPTVTTTYTATCIVGSCESQVSDPHTIKVTPPTAPLIASNTSSICAGGTAILTAPNCAGTVKWSNGATGSSILVTPNATTTYTATCVTSVCESGPSNAVTINVVVPTAPIIASNKTVICSGDSATLTSTGCTGLVKWSNGMTGVSVSVKPTATTSYFATCVINACESGRSNTVTINVNTSGQPPVILASKTNTCVGEEVTLSANNCAGVVMWSNGAEGASIKVTPTTTTSYTAICKATPSTCASGASNTVTINVSPATPPVLTATSTSICVGDSSTITATGCTGTVRWSTGAIGASITVKPTATTTYTATCDRGTCVSPPASITINATSTPPPTIVCSTDSICKGGSVTLLIENCAGVANWSTGETGQAIVVTPLITTSYTANCVVNGCASPSSIQYKITVVEPLKPVLIASKNPITQGETTNITATGCAGSVIWSNGALGASISVFPTSTTTYSAICIVKECESDTAKITITVNECVTKQAPTVTDKRNTCPDSTVDLRSAIVGSAAPGATFIYRLGNIPTSATVATPERAGAGTYYIFERSSTGCFSEPAKVVVTIFNCPDRDTLDLAVKKTVDKATVEVGGEVTYTITLKNNGPVAATNITLIDILPPQLEYIAGTGYSIEGNVIKGTIPLLAANDSLVFSCAVRVIGPGTIINTVQISNLDQIDTKPSNDISSVGVLATGGELGSALGVSNIEAGNDGTFTVTYKAIVKNYSSTAMTNIQMIDSLLKAFPAPTDFIVMSALARPGSTLVINPSFDGKAQPSLLQQNVSTLAAGAADTITIQVKVTPNGFFGPFYNSMTTMATIGGSNVMDISNSGFNTLPLGSTPTPTRFDQPNSLGIAKMAGIPVEIENGVFDVPYSIKVTNLGMNDLTNIQVSDDLNQTFGNGASIVPGSISVTVDPGFTVNPSYTGTGTTIDLLNAATSTLPKGTTRKISIMVRVDTRTATSTAFTNTAIGSALGAGGVVLSDSSASGENPDPNNDLDPSNDSDPTPIVLNNIPGVAMIGVALSVEDTTRKSDGSYDITYKAILKNFGSTTLTDVQLIDSLSKVFSLETGATFKKVGTPIASNVSELAVNPDFDGVNDYDLLIGGNSKLNPGVSDTLRFTVNVSTDGRDTPYLNRVYAFAKAGDLVVTDVSTNGLLPDLNGNNDPTEASESEPTPIVIPAGIELFIPEGFSPNGDGINDVFVIRNAGGQRVNLEIYNRWMTLVYKNSDYKNDWDGTVNSGLRVGSTSQGLPDGTYFYVVKLENGRQYVRFLTITR